MYASYRKYSVAYREEQRTLNKGKCKTVYGYLKLQLIQSQYFSCSSHFTLKIDYILYVTSNLRNQSIVRFKWLVSGRFSPLPLTLPPDPAPLPLIQFSGPHPLHFPLPFPLRTGAHMIWYYCILRI